MAVDTRMATFNLPDVGEGLTEAEILTWHVAVGDEVVVNQIIVEIETAKAAVELPSPFAGRVQALLAEPGVTIAVGTPIIRIDTDPGAGPLPDVAGAGSGAPSGRDSAAASSVVDDDSEFAAGAQDAAGASSDAGAKIGETMADGRVATLVGYIPAAGGRTRRPKRGSGDGDAGEAAPSPEPAPQRAPLATPPVRKFAKDLGIDLATVSASGPEGIISRADVEAASRRAGGVLTSAAAGDGGSAEPETSARSEQASGGESEAAPAPAQRPMLAYDPATRETRVPIKGVRKMMAAAMVASAFTAPHVTEFLTVDVTPMMELRERLKARREFAGAKVTPLTFAARALCLASRRTPEANAAWDGDAGEVVYREYVHLGIAAATSRGLIVPVLRDADQLDLLGLASGLAQLTETARSGRTAPADMTGGTITITNVGVFGVDTGTPIINPGESAILALGSIKDAPWVVGGQLAVRKVCQLALSFDHRVMDGQQGSQFLADVGSLLADPGLAMVF
jgi:pyruvate dehydrogenase E2 component (dihydrolipoamide acetyltransferase)